jgi:hypothetical protein
LNQYILGSYNSDGTQVVDDNVMWNAVAKVSWQMSRASQLSFFHNLQYKLIRYRNDAANNLFVETRARNYNYKYPSVTQAKWTHTLSSRMLVDVGGSVFYTPVDAFRPQPEVRQGDIARYDDIYCTTVGTSACVNPLNNPNFTFRRGIAGFDRPYAFSMSGMYRLPHAMTVSGTMIRDAGFPELTTVLVSGSTVALTQVTQSITVEPRATTRLPALNQLDVSIKRTWRIGATSLEPRLDIYNMMNAATILGRITQLGPTYGRVNTIQRGRLIKVGFNVDF